MALLGVSSACTSASAAPIDPGFHASCKLFVLSHIRGSLDATEVAQQSIWGEL
jgi:hypothetical protein